MASESTAEKRVHNDYTVGWVCALSKEQSAAKAMLDQIHPPLPKPANDSTAYTLGSIGGHNVVIACLPKGKIGNNSAATAATRMAATFPSLKFGLMVGIGGGIPPKVNLGDVVISSPVDEYPGVVQWDFGKAEGNGHFRPTGALNNPPNALLSALAEMETEHELTGPKIPHILKEMGEKWPRLVPKYTCPPTFDNAAGKTRDVISPNVHYGLIASGNQVVKDAKFRDSLDNSLGNHVLCVEMEAAGLLNSFPCIVIRGICDFADSSKSKEWQEYSAAVAAACAKELLQYVQASAVHNESPVLDVLQDLRVEMVKVQEKLDKNAKNEILEWIMPFDYGPIHSDKFEMREPGTCQWFLDTDEYQNWLQNESQTLFCHGMPGAGKTIIASTVINDILDRRHDNSTVGLAYVYCEVGRQLEQTADHIMRSLLKQLVKSLESIPGCVMDLYTKRNRDGVRPQLNEISQALRSVMASYSRVYIIFDALDECDTDCLRKLLSEISNLRHQHPINTFATSRLVETSGPLEPDVIVEIIAHEGDIRKHLHNKLLGSNLSSKLTESDCAEIIDHITVAANGMFLLADLHLKVLKTKKTRKMMRDTLPNLATGEKAYDRAYEEAMERIMTQNNDDKILAMQVVSWVSHATRPLSTQELQYGLASSSLQNQIDETDMIHVDDMVSVCAGLVSVDRKTNIFRLVHATTQEYFQRTQKRWFPNANSQIAIACLHYLRLQTTQVLPSETRELFLRRLLQNNLYEYASQNWGYHAQKDFTREMRQHSRRFLSSPTLVAASSLVITTKRHIGLGIVVPGLTSSLHLLAHFGLEHEVVAWILSGWEAHAKDEFGRTPLSWAAGNGSLAIVKFLLSIEGANPNNHDILLQTPLYIASTNGNPAVVQALLDDDRVDVNTQDTLGYSALHAATIRDDLAVMKILLDNERVDPNKASATGSTPLFSAVVNCNDTTIVRLLLSNHRIDPNKGQEAGCQLLKVVVLGENLALLKLLLSDDRLNPNVEDSDGFTAVEIAQSHGLDEAAEILLADPRVDLPRVRFETSSCITLCCCDEMGRLGP